MKKARAQQLRKKWGVSLRVPAMCLHPQRVTEERALGPVGRGRNRQGVRKPLQG